MTTTFTLVEDPAAFERLAPEWNALLGQSEANGLFLTWEWVFAWWSHLSEDSTLRLGVLRRDGQLIALAPFVFRPASFQQLPPVGTLQFLGSGVAGSDYLDLIVRPGCEIETLAVLQEQLTAFGRALTLMRMRPTGPAAALVDRLQTSGWTMWQGPKEICPWVTLRGHTFDSYLSSLGSEHRYAFRRKLSRLERRYSVAFELVHTEAERRESLATLFALHAQRWHTRGDAGAFSTEALRAFHHDVSQRALAAGWLRLWVLRLDGKPAAALYGFLRERTFYFYQSGFDPAYANDSVGLVLLGVAVRAAIEEGADELDLLHGTERYKAHWTNASRELLRCELHAPGARGTLEREATRLTRKARRITRALIERGQRAASAKTPLARIDHAEPR